MKYGPTIVDNELLYYEIRNDEGMYIGSAIQNQAPFDGCEPVTLKDAEANARLWAASPDLLEALETACNFIKVFRARHSDYIGKDWNDAMDAGVKEMESTIKKAKL